MAGSAQLSQILKQATGVLAIRSEGACCTTKTIADTWISPRASGPMSSSTTAVSRPHGGSGFADDLGHVRGLGLMIGNEFRDAVGKPDPLTAAAAQQEAARRGLLLLTCGALGQVVRFIPAPVVSSDQVDEAAGIWADAVGAVVAG